MSKIVGSVNWWLGRIAKTKAEAHRILSRHELSRSRVIELDGLFKQLSNLPIDVQDYFREAVKCLENGLFRAAIVMAWSGHFYVYAEKLMLGHEQAIRQARKKWQFSDAADLKEQVGEAQILDIGKEVKFLNRANLKILQGRLSTRNECAHPTLYSPSRNLAIGYVDEMLRLTIQYLKRN